MLKHNREEYRQRSVKYNLYDGYASEQSSHRLQKDRHASLLVRKRLPWLDGPDNSKIGHIPGQFDDIVDNSINSKHSSASDSASSVPRPPPALIISKDPALRATGSMPSLRTRSKSEDIRRQSLDPKRPTTPRYGVSGSGSRLTSIPLKNRNKNVRNSPLEHSTLETSDSESKAPTLPPRKSRKLSHESLQDAIAGGNGSGRPNMHAYIWPRSPARTHRRLKSFASHEEPFLNMRSAEPQLSRATQSRKSLPFMPVNSSISEQHASQLSRRPTLFAMPNHLLGSPSGSSASTHDSMNMLPNTIPIPPRTHRRNDALNHIRSRSLTCAVTELETLMGEALDVARDAARMGRGVEAVDAWGSAKMALRRASIANHDKPYGRMSQPLVLSPMESSHDFHSDHSSDLKSNSSSVPQAGTSAETTPTIVTANAYPVKQPIVMDKIEHGQKLKRPRLASFHDPLESDVSPHGSVVLTPPRLYQPPSAESIVRDFAYNGSQNIKARSTSSLPKREAQGAADEYYRDSGQFVADQPGVRPSIAPSTHFTRDLLQRPFDVDRSSKKRRRTSEQLDDRQNTIRGLDGRLRRLDSSAPYVPPRRSSSRAQRRLDQGHRSLRVRDDQRHRHPHLSRLFEAPYYRSEQASVPSMDIEAMRGERVEVDERYENPDVEKQEPSSEPAARYSDPPLLQRDISLKHPRRKHISLREGQGFSLGRHHRRQPIAREWSTVRKRMTATIACINTVFIGLIAGIYAGEVPRIQYQLADTTHKVILGNVFLFATLGVTTLIFWPLPLLHGRKPYTLLSFAIVLPLIFPQALAVTGYHGPGNPVYRSGLLVPRVFEGIALGFANINFLPTLFDLFGASLMSEQPHQEIVVYNDVRRQGGGVGVWLGIWSFCYVGSMSIGFCIGAVVIAYLDPSWGFYTLVILLAFFLLVNVIAPETRRSPYRRSIAQFLDGEDNLKRRVARGEVKLHISNEGPKYWWQEVAAGLILTKRMLSQIGFLVLTLYLGWIYAQVTLIILLLGTLLSRDYRWQPQYVGAASLAVAIGAVLAMPLSQANMFSRSRGNPQRTDSMTMQHSGRITWSSHMLRRCVFTLLLPFAALAYTLSSPGPSISWITPTIFCGFVGFLSNLAIAECVGLIMETFDTSDLQPGVNSKHRLQSLAETTRRRRTNYSSFPRVCAGFFAAQSLGFILSAAATGVSGDVTRAVGAQTSTAIVAAILLFLTLLFIAILWRWKEVQVVPNNPFGVESPNGIVWGPAANDPEWKAVIIGNPSGKMRRVNILELGGLSRWTEIRRLNKLIPG